MGGRLGDAETLSGAPHERQITGRVGRSHQQQAPRITRQLRQPPSEALLDLIGQRHGRGQAESARELRRRQPTRQLQQRERVPARLDDDPIQHLLIESTGQGGVQQRPRVTVPQRPDVELG